MSLFTKMPSIRGAAITSILGVTAILGFTRAVSAGRDVVMAAKFGDGPEVGAYFIVLALHGATSFVLADAVVVAGSRAILRGTSTRRQVLLAAWTLCLGWLTLQMALSPWSSQWLGGPNQDEVRRALIWMAFGAGGVILIGARKAILVADGAIIKSAQLDVIWSVSALLLIATLDDVAGAIYGSWSISLSAVGLVVASTSLWHTRGTTGESSRRADALRSVVPIITASMLYQAMFLMQRRIGADGGATLLAALGYGYKLAALPVMLTLSGVSAWAMRAFHLSLRAGGAKGLKSYVARTLAWSVAAGVVTAVALAVAAPAIVHVVLERGAFDASLAQSTSTALRGYAFAVPFMISYVILVRAFQTTSRLGTPVVASAFGLLACGLLSFYAIRSSHPELGLGMAIAAGSLTASMILASDLYWAWSG